MTSKIFIDYTDKNQETNILLFELLKEYQLIITSCIGPNGSLKFISKEIDKGSTDLSNSSRLISKVLFDFNRISKKYDHLGTEAMAKYGFIKWKFEFINSIINSAHLDNFYDSGLFLYHLTSSFLLYSESFSLASLNNKTILSYMLKKLYDHLSESEANSLIAIKLNLSNIDFLKNLLRTIMRSKHIFSQLDDNSQHKFLNMCLKAFISSFQENTVNSKCFSNINFLFNANISAYLNESKLFNGILFEIDNSHYYKYLNIGTQSMKCVLFDASLSGDFEYLASENFQLEIKSEAIQKDKLALLVKDQIIELCKFLIQIHNVRVILCQKVIHPSIKTFLKRNGIIYVDRLSIMLTSSLSELTGCKVCNSAWNLDQFTPSTFGSLSSISLEKIHGKDYIHFENSISKVPIQTMIICVQNESLLNEIQNLIKVAHYSFKRTVLNGYAFCGGACFYTYSMCYLWKLLNEEFTETIQKKDRQSYINKSKLYDLMNTLKIIFLSFAKKLLNKNLDYFRLDIFSGHLIENNKPRCNCGFIQFSDKNILLNLYDQIKFESSWLNKIFENERNREYESCDNLELIDCAGSKLSSIKISREIIASILQIGVFIHD